MALREEVYIGIELYQKERLWFPIELAVPTTPVHIGTACLLTHLMATSQNKQTVICQSQTCIFMDIFSYVYSGMHFYRGSKLICLPIYM